MLRVGSAGRGALMVAGLLVVGCAAAVPGKTVASPALQRDVTRLIMTLDRASDAGCQERKIMNTEVLSVNRGGGSATERWTVDRCGKPINYLVLLTQSPRGGTDFRVQLEK